MFIFSNLLFGLLILSSVIILYQDFSRRLVSLWVIILFAITTITSVVYFRDVQTLLHNGVASVIYLGFIWLMLKLYLYLKFNKNKPLLNESIGLADILIIFLIGISFNAFGLVLFFGVAFILSLLLFLIYTLLKKNDKEQSIPLAGLLVFLYLSAIILLNHLDDKYLIECSFVKP